MDNELELLACRFLKYFSMCEFYLKELHYFVPRNGNIIVDWRRFCAENEEEFFKFISGDVGEYEYHSRLLFLDQPRRQVVENGSLEWGQLRDVNYDFSGMVKIIKTIRNNLFHGGKFVVGGWDDPDRTEQLLNSSVVIVKIVLKFLERKYHMG